MKPTDMIPFWDPQKEVIKTKDDLIGLGKRNLQSLIGYWRYTLPELQAGLDDLNMQLQLLQSHPNAYAISGVANEFENPTLFEISDGCNLGKNPYPIDQASLQRRSGTTTFNCCGWCSHVMGGFNRGDCTFAGHCLILVNSGILDPEEDDYFLFNKQCWFKTASDHDFNKVRLGLRKSIRRVEKEIQRVWRVINELKRLVRQAEDKPLLPDNRGNDHFPLGQEVIVYLNTTMLENVNPGLYRANVTEGYKSDDGFVTVVVTGVSKPVTFSVNSSFVMGLEEYRYLIANPDFARLWVLGLDDGLRQELLVAITQIA